MRFRPASSRRQRRRCERICWAGVERENKISAAVAGIGLAVACLSGCNLDRGRPSISQLVSLAADAPSVLGLLVDPAAPGVEHEMAVLLRQDGRSAMHLYVIDVMTGAIIASAVTPGTERALVPGPAAPPHDPTDFQKHRYHGALKHYRALRRGAP